MRLNKPYSNVDYAKLAIYCNSNNCHIEDKGGYLEAVENIPYIPTYEDQKQNRELAYQQYVDPITCQIQRLADEEQTPEIIEKIEELKIERSRKVAEIKEMYPYPAVKDSLPVDEEVLDESSVSEQVVD